MAMEDIKPSIKEPFYVATLPVMPKEEIDALLDRLSEPSDTPMKYVPFEPVAFEPLESLPAGFWASTDTPSLEGPESAVSSASTVGLPTTCDLHHHGSASHFASAAAAPLPRGVGALAASVRLQDAIM